MSGPFVVISTIFAESRRPAELKLFGADAGAPVAVSCVEGPSEAWAACAAFEVSGVGVGSLAEAFRGW